MHVLGYSVFQSVYSCTLFLMGTVALYRVCSTGLL